MATTASPSKAAQFDYAKEKTRIDQLIGQWAAENEAIKFRREARKKEVNVSEEQQKGTIPANGTFIARRIIDRNIRLEKPELVAYLEQSPRTVLFKSLSQPTVDTVPLADWFTLGVRYRGWAEPWHRVIDSTCLHGCGWVEIRYDMDKPFNVALEYTPRESLIFPAKLRKSIQKCERILRCYEYLPNELEDAVVAYKFNSEVVKRLCESQKEANRELPIKVYKVFIKRDSIIYVGWYAQDAKEDAWLKAPEPLSFGIIGQNSQLQPVSFFPFVAYLYEFTEEEEFLSVKGRAAKDLADQDALSQLWTGIVNGTTIASEIQASYVNDPANPAGQENTVIKGGIISNREIKHWQAQYPDPFILTVAQALSTENLQSAGKVDYAAQNRQDSRKTATEINSARDQSQRLSSVNIVPLATAVTEVYTYIWHIVQQQIQYSLANPAAPLIDIPEHIDPILWTDRFELSPAGDVEVIKRAEKMSNLQQDMPLFQGTPVYLDLLSKYLELRFPDEAATWKAKLQGMDPMVIMQQLMAIISQVPVNVFPPEQQQEIQTVMQNATAALGIQSATPPMADGRNNQNSVDSSGPGSGSPLDPSTSPIKGRPDA